MNPRPEEKTAARLRAIFRIAIDKAQGTFGGDPDGLASILSIARDVTLDLDALGRRDAPTTGCACPVCSGVTATHLAKAAPSGMNLRVVKVPPGADVAAFINAQLAGVLADADAGDGDRAGR